MREICICGCSREDLFGGLCPRERSWVGVPGGDPFADVVFQRDNAFVDAAFEQLIGEESEPALDLVDPRRSGRGLALFSVSGDISEFDIFVSAHDIR
jgi:hypothetical protein